MSYQYIGEEGDFCVKNPEKTSYLYFPLANENGVKSCVTPDLGGDLKTGQNSFFMAPVSSENLHNDKSTRNFWCILEEKDAWSLTGRSGAQQSRLFSREKEDGLPLLFLQGCKWWRLILHHLHYYGTGNSFFLSNYSSFILSFLTESSMVLY